MIVELNLNDARSAATGLDFALSVLVMEQPLALVMYISDHDNAFNETLTQKITSLNDLGLLKIYIVKENENNESLPSLQKKIAQNIHQLSCDEYRNLVNKHMKVLTF